MRKELLSGLSLGLILGTIGFLRIALWQSLHIFDYGPYHWLVALTVGIALVGVVLWGSLCGLDASVLAAALRTRSGDVLGALCRHAGRCDRAGDLFQRRAVHSARHAVVRKYSLTSVTLGKRFKLRNCMIVRRLRRDPDPFVARARIGHRLHDPHVAHAILEIRMGIDPSS